VGDPEQAKVKRAYVSRPDMHKNVFDYVLRCAERD
jgi:hypothetical protein